MDTENSEAIPEQKKHIPPFFITPNESWPDTCKILTSSVESLNISLSKGHFLKLSSQLRRLRNLKIKPDKSKYTLQMLQSEEAPPPPEVHYGLCAGDHPTNDCNLQPNAERKCINCQGNHAAFYRLCPNFPRRNPPQQKRIYPTSPQKPRIKISLDENLTNHQIIPEGEKPFSPTQTSSDQNEQTHLPTTVPSKFPPNPTEVDLFSTILKLVHQEEIKTTRGNGFCACRGIGSFSGPPEAPA
ncbi:hypothetical protein CDAR_574521 [Caerostris darwini]|uniref:Uncharacterized protein n=1 Tax=Caerostris darwini TaxID=1538125 RepID=A0AAV4QJ19_9ARAC|nr:hypothetical protein CDAR_574521 [Caerostris darwini]